MKMVNLRHGMAVIGLGLLASACATAKVPTDRLAASQAAIRTASEVGAERVPDASLYLRFAQEEQEQGRSFIAAGENEKAAVAFHRASADAELAIALARQAGARNEAKAAADALQAGSSGAR